MPDAGDTNEAIESRVAELEEQVAELMRDLWLREERALERSEYDP